MQVLAPRSCGPGAFLRWIRAAVSLLARMPLEWWLASWVVLAMVAAACQRVPALWPAAVLLGMGAGRMLWEVAGALLERRALSGVLKALVPVRPGRWALAIAVAVALAVAWSWSLPAPASAAWISPFHAWVLACWMAWLLRPWGPIGFVGPLRRAGCPPLACFALQARAFHANPVALAAAMGAWGVGLVALLLAPLLAVAGVFFWPFLLRSAYADIFQGGLPLAPPRPAHAAPAPAAKVCTP